MKRSCGMPQLQKIFRRERETGLEPVKALFEKSRYIKLFHQTLGIKPFLALFFCL
nr:MAG TPA: hypothetical protein [Caudoviricetes sp.]